MIKREIRAQSTSFPFSSYVAGHSYHYETAGEVGIGDRVLIQAGRYAANEVCEVSVPIHALATVTAVDRELQKLTLLVDEFPVGPRAILTTQPGAIVERALVEVKVVSIRIFEPDDESVFTDVPVASTDFLRHEAPVS